MKCPNCGKELLPDDKFCTGCGRPVVQQSAVPGSNSVGPEDTATESPARKGQHSINYMVRRYFFGFKDIFYSLLIVFAVYNIFFHPSTFLVKLGAKLGAFNIILMIAMVCAAGLHLFCRFTGVGKSEAADAFGQSVEILKSRAREYLGVAPSYILVGPGELSGELSREKWPRLRRMFSSILQVYHAGPSEGFFVSSDDVPRYLLVQLTAYCLQDNKLVIYTGNIDSSTLLVYEEQVTETAYQDIDRIAEKSMYQSVRKGMLKRGFYPFAKVTLGVGRAELTASAGVHGERYTDCLIKTLEEHTYKDR